MSNPVNHKRWFILGREVRRAEEAGRTDRVNHLIAKADNIFDTLAGKARANFVDAYITGRWSN